MDHKCFVLLILTILIDSTVPELIHQDKSLGVTPNWFGSFYTTSECDVGKCCCIYGLLTLSKAAPNYLHIQGQLDGSNCPPNRQIDSAINMPNGFSTNLYLLVGQVDITLSADSRTLRLDNEKTPSCSGDAIRDHAQSMVPLNPMKMVLIIIPILIGKNIF